MPTTTRVLLHSDGPVLWPAMKPLAEVQALKDTTPAVIWETTYQGNPVPPAGTVFLRAWWAAPAARFDAAAPNPVLGCVGRWISWDTALKDESDNAWTVAVVGELWPDYRLALRHVYRERLQFPQLPPAIARLASRYNADGKLRGVVIEDKASGTSAIQTLRQSAEPWLRRLLKDYQPHGDKETRAQYASVWCSNGSVLLPAPSADVPWLADFEDELFGFPNSAFKDQVDAFGQLVNYLENLLAEGHRARKGKMTDADAV